MKLAKLSLVVGGAFALAICLKPSVGWSTRPYSAMVTGQVTAMPGNGEIEIAHQLYHVKANSVAAKALSSLYVGENVDAVLDSPVGGTGTSATPEVVILTVHAASS
jgi:hypothetical protein